MTLLTHENSEEDMVLRSRFSERVIGCGFVLALAVLLLSTFSVAQQGETPKVEIFAGYQWLHPGGTVPAPGLSPNAPLGLELQDLPAGGGASGTYFFSNHLGLELDFGRNQNDNSNETTLSIGPHLEYRHNRLNLFGHAMVGWNYLTTPGLDSRSGIGTIVGGGLDIQITRLLGFRLVEADWVWAHQNFSDVVAPEFPDLRRLDLEGARVRTGLVFNFGYPKTETPAAACSVQPSEVMVGEPITVTAAGSHFNPKHTLTYTWESNGGKVMGKDGTASIDTNGVAGGSYAVTAHISDPKMKSGGTASCSANFTVKEPPKNPPTMSCSASPSTLQAGGSSTITCACTSPDNVPVNVSNWTSTGGSVSGSGSTATLNTSGASAGAISVSATCTDSRGLNAQASTQVSVENPPPPAPPQAQKLSQCDFPNKVKPWRVDNTCKAILDDVAKNLQQNADARLVIVGNADAEEKRPNLAAERAVNSKAYLTSGEAQLGIDASRIETRTGNAGTKTAEYWVVPAGGTYSGEGTQPVDESKVKAVPDHPAAGKKKMKATQ
jgi:outer membrane protein OmpA-like peptidoglycan-associated protein